MEAVAGFAGVAMTNAVGQDDVVFGGVEELTGAKEVTAKEGGEEVGAAAGGAVHDKDGVDDFAGVIFDWLTERSVVDVEFRESGLAALEGEVRYFIVPFGLVGVGFGRVLLRVYEGG